MLWYTKIHVNTYLQTKFKKKLISIISNLQIIYHFKKAFRNSGPTPNTDTYREVRSRKYAMTCIQKA